MDDPLTISIDTLPVDLTPAAATALATGDLAPLRAAVLAALRDHPAVRPYTTADGERA
jgi:hypothetical protein